MEHLREYNKVSGELEVWLQDKEAKLQECGPIGANLDRCIEQEDILAVSVLGGVWFERVLLRREYVLKVGV